MPGRAHFYTKTPDQRLFPCRGSAHRAARVSPTVRLPGYIRTSIVMMKPIRFLGDSLAALRVVYIARLPESVYVLHAFQKTSAATSRPDIAKARRRYMELTRTHR